jgi:hypothetical protein
VSIAVATAEEVEALRELVARLEAKVERLAAGAAAAPGVMSPKQVAHHYRIRERTVYEACRSGLLVAEERPARGGRIGYLVALDDAARWYARTRRTNQ